MEQTKRTYSPRNITPAKTVDDLQKLSDQLIASIHEAEGKMDILTKSLPALELLEGVKEDLNSLPAAIECSSEIHQNMIGVLSSDELALLNGSKENFLLLKSQEENLKVLRDSIKSIHLLNDSIHAIRLCSQSVEAIKVLNQFLDDQNNLGKFKKFWNRILEGMKFR